MKEILASILLLAMLSTPVTVSDAAPPSPEAVTTVIDSDTVTVYWTAPVMSPLDLQAATYKIYGNDSTGDHFITDVPAMTFSAEVEFNATFSNYGVRVVLRETLSDIQHACFSFTLNPPDVQPHCVVA